jgi:hypothetical protein
MTNMTMAFGSGRYSQRPALRVRTGPPYAESLIFWVVFGIGFILLASQGGPSLADSCGSSGVSICGP